MQSDNQNNSKFFALTRSIDSFFFAGKVLTHIDADRVSSPRSRLGEAIAFDLTTKVIVVNGH